MYYTVGITIHSLNVTYLMYLEEEIIQLLTTLLSNGLDFTVYNNEYRF